MRTASIITTGRELITGSVSDLNGPFLCRVLDNLGINIQAVITVGDDISTLEKYIRLHLESSDFVITTGGLGPTSDDVTRQALKRISDFNPVIYQPALERMGKVFSGRGKTVEESDISMAMVPDNAVIFPNDCGIAPGFSIQEGSKYIIALPGPPPEVEAMFTNHVVPWLSGMFNLESAVQSTSFHVIWMKESEIDRLLVKVKDELNISYGITASRGIAKITFYSADVNEYRNRLQFLMEDLFKENVIGYLYNSPEEELVAILAAANLTISAAESCTGGLAGKRITDISGSSKVFKGGAVTYCNESKIKLLHVNENTISKYGAVSEQTAVEMASGAKKLFNTDIAFAITGIAGPDGGSVDKPVGTVCFGFATPAGIKSERLRFTGNRDMIRAIASLYALNRVRTDQLKILTGTKS